MLKSMTAYGRASIDDQVGRFVAEIQSINRKYLEINVVLPKELTRFDAEIKKWISAEVARGQINVKITVAFDLISPLIVTPNLPLARQLKEAWEKIISELGLDPKKFFTSEMLAQEPNLLTYDQDLHDEPLYRQALQRVILQALQQVIAMKKKEGESLQADIASRIEMLGAWIKSIAKKAPEATVKYRQKLVQRLEEVLAGSVENEERILREVIIFAERIDITEEITRFELHLAQINDLMNNHAHSSGKTMEFFLQELNREANTISSKSSDIEVSHLIVNIKSELERIREQIQNIE